MKQSEAESLQKKNDVLFLVSSAIHTKHGFYNDAQRLDQTIETCKSINSKVSNRCNIIVLDGGYDSITEDERTLIKEHIHKFFYYGSDAEMRGIQSVPSQDIVKNASEILMFGSFFSAFGQDIKRNYKRVFKMSGRYLLNDNFNFDMHMSATHKIVINGPYTSQFTPDITGGLTRQYMSRLWSFDTTHMDYIAECYVNMYRHMIHRVNNAGYVDIEHLLYNYLNPRFIQISNPIGIEGTLGPSGAKVSD